MLSLLFFRTVGGGADHKVLYGRSAYDNSARGELPIYVMSNTAQRQRRRDSPAQQRHTFFYICSVIATSEDDCYLPFVNLQLK